MEIGFPWWLSDRESSCNAGDSEDVGLIPGLGRSPGGGNVNPLQYSRLVNPVDRETWQATVHGVTKSGTQLKRPRTHTLRSSILTFKLPVFLF